MACICYGIEEIDILSYKKDFLGSLLRLSLHIHDFCAKFF